MPSTLLSILVALKVAEGSAIEWEKIGAVVLIAWATDAAWRWIRRTVRRFWMECTGP